MTHKMLCKNLNDVLINDDDLGGDGKQYDYSTTNNDRSIEVYFRDIEHRIIDKIRQCDTIFGCVAWLTNENILRELSKKECLIVVQEEDFLRPDTNFCGNKQKWKEKIMKLYNNLSAGDKCVTTCDFMVNRARLTKCGVRRCGMLNKNKLPAFPRMHNKFIVCCNNTEIGKKHYEPVVVLTGSFNYTENSTNSLENVVCIKDKKIAKAYLDQFGQILIVSMELDWSGDWEPKQSGMRYGT